MKTLMGSKVMYAEELFRTVNSFGFTRLEIYPNELLLTLGLVIDGKPSKELKNAVSAIVTPWKVNWSTSTKN